MMMSTDLGLLCPGLFGLFLILLGRTKSQKTISMECEMYAIMMMSTNALLTLLRPFFESFFPFRGANLGHFGPLEGSRGSLGAKREA